MGPACTVGHPRTKHGEHLTRERCAALFAPFAATANMGPRRPYDVFPPKAAQLGHAQAGLKQERDDRVVAAAEPGRAVWRREQRLLLGTIERGHELALGLLARDREDALTRRAEPGLLERNESKERVNCGK